MPVRGGAPLALLLGLALAPAALAGAPGSAPRVQDEAARPDQVVVRNPRDGSTTTLTGTLTRNELDQVEIDGQKVDSANVLRVGYGEAPPAFRDAQTYFDRGDWPNAAKSFKLVAGDAGARDVVRAAARLQAAEALLQWGAIEPAHFAEAADEARRFLDEFPSHREVPKARLLLGRAQRLAGNPADALQTWRALYAECAAGAPPMGYQRVDCLRAGLLAARAALALPGGPDTLAARELFAALVQAANAAQAEAPAGSAQQMQLRAIADEASLGDGFVELASGNPRQAQTFFNARVAGLSPQSGAAERFGARLGLGEALLAEGKPREAQMQLARVSAMDHTDRDRVARALVRLAESAQRLGDGTSREWGRTWLTTVSERYGDTPFAARARELLKTY